MYTCATHAPTGTACTGLSTFDTQTCKSTKNNLVGAYFSHISSWILHHRKLRFLFHFNYMFAMRRWLFPYVNLDMREFVFRQSLFSFLVGCGNGGPTYSCPAGSYKFGRKCSGFTVSDTQSCASMNESCHSIILTIDKACNNGGASYVCAAGSYKTGSPCTGADLFDTQTCQGNYARNVES